MASSGGPRLGQIERYGAASQVTTPTDLSVAGGFVNKIAVEPPWVAWIDLADSKNNDNRRLNLGNHNVAGWSSTSSGFPAIHAVDLAIDADRVYWLENETGGTSLLKALPLTDTLTATQAPTQLVSGLGVVNALAVDEHHVYFTTRDRGGAIFYVARDTVTTRTAAEVSVLAEDRGEPFAIAASADSPLDLLGHHRRDWHGGAGAQAARLTSTARLLRGARAPHRWSRPARANPSSPPAARRR